jgi:glycoside/pentoside/hexuronide:cation symporter, GPH family
VHLVQLYIPVIAVLYLVGAFFLRFYKIDRASHEANLASIRAREAAEITENTTS